MDESGAVRRLAAGVCARIVRPYLFAGLRVESDDSVVRGAQVQHVVDHQWRVLEGPWGGTELGQRLLVRLPRPGDREPLDVGPIDIGCGGVLRTGLIGTVVRPLNW